MRQRRLVYLRTSHIARFLTRMRGRLGLALDRYFLPYGALALSFYWEIFPATNVAAQKVQAALETKYDRAPALPGSPRAERPAFNGRRGNACVV